jgi:hypothetical protein
MSRMPNASDLHVVEPTLRDEAGHCCSFVRSLVRALPDDGSRLHVWMHRDAAGLFEGEPRCVPHPHFSRLLRQIESVRLYRRLLGEGDRLFLSTAGRTDLRHLDLASSGSITDPGRVFAYVHWYRPSPSRRKSLERIARRHPGIEILVPTEWLAEQLSSVGFPVVHVAAYPVDPGRAPDAAPHRAARALYAGAARLDKGFPTVAQIAERLAARESGVPITIQCSPTHRRKHEPAVARAIESLRGIAGDRVTLREDTLSEADYRSLFPGSITLQPYDPQDFADRISGVTLDAFAAGSPVIVPRGTWMARLVDTHGAGRVVDDARDVDVVLEAIESVEANWASCAAGAIKAGLAIAEAHDARGLVQILSGTAAGAPRS